MILVRRQTVLQVNQALLGVCRIFAGRVSIDQAAQRRVCAIRVFRWAQIDVFLKAPFEESCFILKISESLYVERVIHVRMNGILAHKRIGGFHGLLFSPALVVGEYQIQLYLPADIAEWKTCLYRLENLNAAPIITVCDGLLGFLVRLAEVASERGFLLIVARATRGDAHGSKHDDNSRACR